MYTINFCWNYRNLYTKNTFRNTLASYNLEQYSEKSFFIKSKIKIVVILKQIKNLDFNKIYIYTKLYKKNLNTPFKILLTSNRQRNIYI